MKYGVSFTLLEETGDANSNVIKGLADGTQSGQAVHVGTVDTGHLKLLEPATSGKIGLNVDTTYLATAHATGLTVKSVGLDSAVMTSGVVINAASQIKPGAAFQYSGASVFSGSAPTSWTALDLSGTVGARRALVFLKVKTTGNGDGYKFRSGDDTEGVGGGDWISAQGTVGAYVSTNQIAFILAMTDATGGLDWIAEDGDAATINLLGFIY
jgi:hypothetical protein